MADWKEIKEDYTRKVIKTDAASSRINMRNTISNLLLQNFCRHNAGKSIPANAQITNNKEDTTLSRMPISLAFDI